MPVDILKLNSFGLLQIAGPDAEKFLQGQLTCDVRSTTAQRWIAGAHCNHKGRMIANFLIAQPQPSCFVLCLPRDIIGALKSSLDKYIVFSKAETVDISDSRCLYGVIGEQAEHWCDEHCTSATNETIAISDQQLLCLSQGNDETLETQLTQSDDELWQQTDILAGRGWVTAATREEFLPQMLNLDCDAMAGISFKKGCYTGQEIVARMHYKGQTKKRLYAFTSDNQAVITVGDSLYAGSESKVIGSVINVSNSATGTSLLAVASIDAMTENDELFASDQRQKLQQIELPYAINS